MTEAPSLRSRAVDPSIALLLIAAAALVRLPDVGAQTAFVDELTWIREGRSVVRRLAKDPLAPPAAWGKTQRHPGVLLGLVAGTFGQVRPSDGRDRVLARERAFGRARWVMAWAGIATVVLLFLLGRATLGRGPAACAAALLAVSPFHAAMSGWLECDALLTLFCTASLLCFGLYLERRGAVWLFAAAVAAAEAVVAKLPGLLLGPALVLAMLAFPAGNARWTTRLAEPLRPVHLCAFAAFALCVWASWPRTWLDPAEIARMVLWAGDVGGHHSNWFWGELTRTPPWWYYLAVVPLRLSELEIVAVLVAFVALLRGLARRRSPPPTVALHALFAIVFFGFMSVAGKKLGARYVLPIWPALCVCAATPLWQVVQSIGARLPPRWRPVTLGAGIALLAAYTVWFLAPTYPARFAAYNRVLGGLETAAAVELVHGIGEREVARKLDTLPRTASVAVLGHVQTVAFHAHRSVKAMLPDQARRAVARGSLDHVVVFLHSERRTRLGPIPPALMDRIWSLRVDGATIAKLYRARRAGRPSSPAGSVVRP